MKFIQIMNSEYHQPERSVVFSVAPVQPGKGNMIKIDISPHGLTVDGHAGYAKTGNDIICAAVSALAQGLIHSLDALTDDTISYRLVDGHIDINYRDLSERGKLLIDSFFLAVSDIQLTYGKEYVKITVAGRA